MQLVLWVLGSIVVLCILLVIAVISIYNGLVKHKNRFMNAFSQIDVQLNRRYDLIPNLVETAKKYMEHETETLEKVIAARNQAHQVQVNLGKNALDEGGMENLMKAERELSSGLGRLMAIAENYPDLKADNTMINLMEELSSTENKVSFARQNYNDCVMAYNTAREVFPANIISGMFNFQMAKLFQIDDSKIREAVKVSFD